MMTLLISLRQIAHGVFITLVLMSASLCISYVLAVIFTIINYAGNKWLKKCLSAVIFLVRGTPLLVQIYLIYYGAGQFSGVRESVLWPILREPLFCAIIALSINSACYTTVLLEAALASIPENEMSACAALGMSKWQTFVYICFPRGMGIVLPAYSNEVMMLLKGTTLASTITLLDVMGVTQQLIAQSYAVIEWYLFAAMIYLSLNALITYGFSRLIKQNNSYISS